MPQSLQVEPLPVLAQVPEPAGELEEAKINEGAQGIKAKGVDQPDGALSPQRQKSWAEVLEESDQATRIQVSEVTAEEIAQHPEWIRENEIPFLTIECHGQPTQGAVDLVASKPSFIINATTRLSWKHANINIKCSINEAIQAWIDFDEGFRNWIFTCLTSFVATDMLLTWAAPVPDQWIEELGVNEIFFHREYDGKIHIMN